jgi:hypothetical protein
MAGAVALYISATSAVHHDGCFSTLILRDLIILYLEPTAYCRGCFSAGCFLNLMIYFFELYDKEN